MQALVDLVLAYFQDMVMQPGIARASYMNEQSESLAGILPCTHAAIFLTDMHGEEHTDEIGMHTVLYSLQGIPRRACTRCARCSACRAGTPASPARPGRRSPSAAERPMSEQRAERACPSRGG